MQAISIIGFSNSGKTTLISRLSECLEARGLKVAIAKHTHHELDKPDTDTALLMGPKRTIVGLSNTKDGKGEAAYFVFADHPGTFDGASGRLQGSAPRAGARYVWGQQAPRAAVVHGRRSGCAGRSGS